MPYISSETVKAIRTEIKETFKDMKFSVTTEHHSTIVVALMEGKFDVEKDYVQLNHYHLDSKQMGYSEEVVEMGKQVLAIINKHQEQKELTYDSDYGSVPTFYINIHIGKWDRPYKKVA